MNIKQLFDDYVRNKKMYNSEGTLRFYNDHIPSLISYFGPNKSVELITRYDVLGFIEEQQKNKISNNTINHRVGILKAACRFFEFKDLDFYRLKKLPIVFVTYGWLDENKQEVLSSVIKALPLRNLLIVSLFLDTGVRLSELTNIEVNNIDLDKRVIFLKITKTKRTRYVYFTQNTAKLIKKYLKDDKRKYLFASRYGGRMSVNSMESVFARIRKKFGIDKLSPHMLRHTLCTNLYNEGADLIFIESVMGHSNTETTKRYIHTDVDSNRDRYDKVKKTTFSKKR